jgi:fibronectin type III domain protein
VQLYAADTASGVTLPAQQLIGFARIDLEPGESKTVRFAVPMSVLGYTGLSGDFVIEPGPVEVNVGSSSSEIKSTATLNVTGKTRVIFPDTIGLFYRLPLWLPEHRTPVYGRDHVNGGLDQFARIRTRPAVEYSPHPMRSTSSRRTLRSDSVPRQ